MKKNFSKFLMLCLMALFSINAFADGIAYTINFKDTGGSDGSSAKTATADIIADGADNMTVASAANIYQGKSGYGIKGGAGSKAGSITLNTTASGTVKPTKIAFVAARWGSDAQDVNVKINGGTAQALGLNSATLTTYEIEMDGNTDLTSIAIEASTASKARFYLQSLTVYANGSGTEKVKTPTITPNGGSFATSQEVSISCATEGAAITYTTNDWATSNTYTAPFTVTATTTVKAKATKAGMDDSNEASATFTKVEPITCAQANALGKDEAALLNEVTVTYVNGAYVYVKDASGETLVYDFAYGEALNPGDVVNGIIGVGSPYNGLPELKPTVTVDALTITTGGVAPEPTVLTAAPTAADVNRYIKLTGVTGLNGEWTVGNTGSNLTGSFNGEDVLFRNSFKLGQTFTEGSTYDVVGAVAVYNSTVQVYFISAEEVTAGDKYAINIDPVDFGDVTTSPADEAAEGVTVTINIVPDEHYYVESVSVTGDESGNPIPVDNLKFTMPAEPVTIVVIFDEAATHTVTYKSLGTDLDSEEVYDGEAVSAVPTPKNAPAGWTFAGWTTETVNNTTVAPAIYNLSAPVTSDLVLNALFTKVEGGGTGGWVATELSAVLPTDAVVVTGTTSDNKSYAMSNDNGTGSAPAAVAVTVENGTLTGEIAENVKWNVSGNATDGYVFNVNGDAEKWLYCTSSNNGLRVGDSASKQFTITDDYLFNVAQSRYVGIYSGSDWRSYTSINNNIKDQTFTFFKEVSGTTYYTTVTPADANLTIGSAKWGTFAAACDIDLAETGKAVRAYTVDADVKPTLIAANDGEHETVIPAGTPVLVYCDEEVNMDFCGEKTASGTSSYKPGTGNYLYGVYVAAGLGETTGHATYVLQNHSGNIGWYKVNYTTSSQTKLNANRCLLLIPETAPAAAKEFIGLDGDATGIADVENVGNAGNVGNYNLSGVKVGANYKGIVIINGKKVFNK